MSVKEEQQSIFNVFPNPTTDGRITISLNNNNHNTYIVNVYDQAGRLVYLNSINSDKQIDISNQATGVYIIELFDGTQSFFKQVIKY